MKKGLVMGLVATIAACAGVVITIMALVKKGKCKLNSDLDYDEADYLDDDFDDYDDSISENIIDEDDENWQLDADEDNTDKKAKK